MMWFLVLSSLAVSALGAPKANCDINAMDKCTERVLFFAQNTSATLDKKGVEWECQQEKVALDCADKYAADGCVTGIAQGVFKLISEGARAESDFKCDKKHAKHQAYFNYVPCINKGGVKLNQCMRRATAELEAANNSKTKVPHACCAVGALVDCLEKTTAEHCDQKHVDYVHGIIFGVAGDMLDTICTKYQHGTESCNKLDKLTLGSPKFKTPIPPLIEALRAL